MAPLTDIAVGTRYPFAPAVSTVGPLYVGSELLLAAVGCVIVDVGHCTRNDWAPAIAARPARSGNSESWRNTPRAMHPPLPLCTTELLQDGRESCVLHSGCYSAKKSSRCATSKS